MDDNASLAPLFGALIGLSGVLITLIGTIVWSVVSRRRDEMAAQVRMTERHFMTLWTATFTWSKPLRLEMFWPTLAARHHVAASREIYELLMQLGRPVWWRPRRRNFILTLIELQKSFHDAAVAWLVDPRDLAARKHFMDVTGAVMSAVSRWRVRRWSYLRAELSEELLEGAAPFPGPPPQGWRRLLAHESITSVEHEKDDAVGTQGEKKLPQRQ